MLDRLSGPPATRIVPAEFSVSLAQGQRAWSPARRPPTPPARARRDRIAGPPPGLRYGQRRHALRPRTRRGGLGCNPGVGAQLRWSRRARARGSLTVERYPAVRFRLRLSVGLHPAGGSARGRRAANRRRFSGRPAKPTLYLPENGRCLVVRLDPAQHRHDALQEP